MSERKIKQKKLSLDALNRDAVIPGRDDETGQRLESFFSQCDKTMDGLETIVERGRSVAQQMPA